jgi:hypothetical protein
VFIRVRLSYLPSRHVVRIEQGGVSPRNAQTARSMPATGKLYAPYLPRHGSIPDRVAPEKRIF